VYVFTNQKTRLNSTYLGFFIIHVGKARNLIRIILEERNEYISPDFFARVFTYKLVRSANIIWASIHRWNWVNEVANLPLPPQNVGVRISPQPSASSESLLLKPARAADAHNEYHIRVARVSE
jgi:hypothetical protein